MPSIRIDIVITLIAAVMTILLIKSTSLLPSSLYFQFSKAFSSDLGAFLVPRPVLEARQQCEIARLKGFTLRECPTGEAIDRFLLTDEQKGLLIQAVIEQKQIRTIDGKVVLNGSVGGDDGDVPLLEIISSEASGRDDLGDFANKRVERLADALAENFVTEVQARYDQLAGATPDDSFMEDEPSIEEGSEELTDDTPEAIATRTVVQKLAAAEMSVRSTIAGGLQIDDTEIRIGDLDQILRGDMDLWTAAQKIQDRISKLLWPEIEQSYLQALEQNGIDVVKLRSDVERAVITQVGPEYVLALLIRLMVPLVAGLVAILLLGPNVRVSVAVGCALSAFLLAWPIALLWDGVVEQAYRHLRMEFLAFYAAYVASYFSMAYLGATLGGVLSGRLRLPFAWHGDEPPQLAAVGAMAREIPYQIVLNLATNGATLALSFAFFGADIGYDR